MRNLTLHAMSGNPQLDTCLYTDDSSATPMIMAATLCMADSMTAPMAAKLVDSRTYCSRAVVSGRKYSGDPTKIMSTRSVLYYPLRVTTSRYRPLLPGKTVRLSWQAEAIEAQVGISRACTVEGLDGSDAVVLWNRWRHRRDPDARERLLAYNATDCVNLEPLADRFYAAMAGLVLRGLAERLREAWTIDC